jgi:hypothetical protein
MSWLDALLDRGREAKRDVTDVAPVAKVQPVKRGPVNHVIIQTSAAHLASGDPGRVEIGHYYVADGAVVMCSEDGRPTGQRQELGPNEDPHKIAGRLLRATWLNSNSDFNRPLRYQRLSIA